MLSVSSNNLGVDGGKVLAEGLRGNNVITELSIAANNLTYNGQDMSGIITLADVIKDMRAMTKFDISSNDLCAEGTKLLAAALKGNQIMTELNISSNSMTYGSAWGDMSGVIALADVISGMGAMTSLNLALNRLEAEGAEIVAEAIKVTKCTTVIILVPLSCPSDFSINCCCLLLSAGYGGDNLSAKGRASVLLL